MVSKNITEEDNLFNKRRTGTEHSFEEWPEEVRGLKLGFKFHNMYYWRSQSTFRCILEGRGYFRDMEAPHSLWSTNNMYGDLLIALKEFKSIYGHLNVPPDFIVPVDRKNSNISVKDCNISNDNRNDSSNKIDDNKNNGNHYNDNKNNDNNHYYDNKNIDNNQDNIDHYSYNFQKQFDNTNSKEKTKNANFDDATKWTKKSQGLKLGLKVRHLRFRAKFLAKNREELTALGFDWRQSENNEKDLLEETNLDFDKN